MFSKIPFLKLFIALLLGILASVFFTFDISFIYLIISFLLVVFFHVLTQKFYKLAPYFGLLFFVFVFLVGAFRATEYKHKASLKPIVTSGYVLGKIISPPKVYDSFVKTNLEIIAIEDGQNNTASQGRVLLMLEKDSLSNCLMQGDYLQFMPKFKDIDANKNPQVFNYKRYLFFHLISQQAYLKSKQWNKINIQEPWFDSDKIIKLRSFLHQKYSQYGISGENLSVLSALTLGYKNTLDAQIQKSYASTGAIHVLAVSGLHVGIIFVIISQLLQFLGVSKLARSIRFIFILGFIWFFALLTGASPSVLRASLMFSFIALGQALNRKGTIFNSIFASAFLLLIYNPFLLFDLSFQLSYSAVISIVYFQPKIFKWIPIHNKLTEWVWGLTSVSLAAQIGAFPISIYYFHQFPNYFLLSNFIVIPLATLIIWLTLLFFSTLNFDFIAQFIADLIQHIIAFQNILIRKIEHLPHAISKNLYIDNVQLVILILIVLSLMILSTKIKYKNALLFGVFILLFFMYSDLVL